MNIKITKKPSGGEVRIPSSKSELHRLLICSALSDKKTEVFCDGISDDVRHTADCLEALGASVDISESFVKIKPIEKVRKNRLLDCGESGSTLRFLIPVTLALGADADFKMSGRLPERPLHPLDTLLENCGMKFEKKENILSCRGLLAEKDFSIAADVSSQFITGLLLSLPLNGGGHIRMDGKIESSGYIRMSAEIMNQFGAGVRSEGNEINVSGDGYVSDGIYRAYGDWSGASFWICAGLFTDNGILCRGLRSDSFQGDSRIVRILRDFCGDVSNGPETVGSIRCGSLRGTEIDASDIPDLVPVLSVVAALSDGETRIYNASRLRLKESDRIYSVLKMLRSLGAEAEELEDGLLIRGKETLEGGTVESFGDHRIAMSAAVASLMCRKETVITNAECVSKSYPSFWEDFKALGGEYEVV